jgi:hypothetical protein
MMVVVVNDGVDMMKEGVNLFEEKHERVLTGIGVERSIYGF